MARWRPPRRSSGRPEPGRLHLSSSITRLWLAHSSSIFFRNENPMHSTRLASNLVATCHTETARLLDSFAAAPTCSGLFDVGAVAEMVALGDAVPGIEGLRSAVCDAAARWLQSGVIEDLCFSRA